MSISFDRIADRYDATRGFPPGIGDQIGAAFRRESGLAAGARLLEIGVGTGRIALPLVAQGYRYIGADISTEMMRRLRQRLPAGQAIDLARADATALPLRTASVDGAVAVHVLHLISGWERAVAELRRVIRPGGALALGFNEGDDQASSAALRERWRAVAQDLGGDTQRPGVPIDQAAALIESLFGAPRRVTLASWERHETLRERLDQLASRTTSDTWQIPDAVLRESVRRAEAWAQETYGDLDAQHAVASQFTMLFYTAPGAG